MKNSMGPEHFSLDYLSNLKFRELVKLAVHHKVSKRWAKKQDIINSLLALKKIDEVPRKDNLVKEDEWKDGSKVFMEANLNAIEEPQDRRLTFNVENHDSSRLTFDVCPKIDSRLTFDIPPSDMPQVIDSRATYEVSQTPQNLMKEVFGEKGLNKESEVFQSSLATNLPVLSNCLQETILEENCDDSDRRLTFNISSKEDNKKELPTKCHPEIKMLTIPIMRISRGPNQKPIKRVADACTKISSKSIQIKKVSKTEFVRTPSSTVVKLNRIDSARKMSLPSRVSTTVNTPIVKDLGVSGNKENIQKSYGRRKSKTEDNTLVKKPNPVKVQFLTPNRTRSATQTEKDIPKISASRSSRIPKPKSSVSLNSNVVKKPITATKMPDFASIHKRQFEQMDSLHDYQRKKAERAKKLFGTPQPGIPAKHSVFHFRSTNVEKKMGANVMKPTENLKNTSPVKSRTAAAEKKVVKEAVRKRNPLRTNNDLKDKNRNQIHGVRTNKRFELQMKYRNIQV